MKDIKSEKMAYNDSPENLDDIFLIKDKNKPKANKERRSEEKARETKQIVDNLKKMQEPGKRWNEEQKNEVHYERNGLVRFESLINKSQEKLKEEKAIKCLWKI